MKKQSQFVYIAAAVSFLVPASGRFATGLIICIAAIFLTFFGTLINTMVKKFVSIESSFFYQFVVSILLCSVFKQFLLLYSPVLSVYMGFTIYLTAFSSMFVGFFSTNDNQHDFSYTLSQNMLNILKFCLFTLLFFLLRDYLGYSTFTLPGRMGFIEYKIPSIHLYSQSFFWGSIPFAIIILALILAGITFISHRFDIVRRKIY